MQVQRKLIDSLLAPFRQACFINSLRGNEELQKPPLAGKLMKLPNQGASAHPAVTLSLAPGVQVSVSTQLTARTPLAEGRQVTYFFSN